MRSKNPLDVLFRGIQRDLDLEASIPRRVPLIKHQSTYANPENWRLGRVVCLVHASEGTIGIFQEYFHKLSPSARRLLPAVPGLPVDREELVFGDYWLHPRFSACGPEPDSEAEVKAIIARFNELMALEDDPE
jgi:hypothetical protein